MRTGLALMGFGFVVARFGLFLREIAAMGHAVGDPRSTAWSLWIGTALIVLGVVASTIASYEYYRFLRFLKRQRTYTPRTALLAVVVTIVVAMLGCMMAVYLLVVSP
jgi:putative membrane protein